MPAGRCPCGPASRHPLSPPTNVGSVPRLSMSVEQEVQIYGPGCIAIARACSTLSVFDAGEEHQEILGSQERPNLQDTIQEVRVRLRFPVLGKKGGLVGVGHGRGSVEGRYPRQGDAGPLRKGLESPGRRCPRAGCWIRHRYRRRREGLLTSSNHLDPDALGKSDGTGFFDPDSHRIHLGVGQADLGDLLGHLFHEVEFGVLHQGNDGLGHGPVVHGLLEIVAFPGRPAVGPHFDIDKDVLLLSHVPNRGSR